MEVVGTTQMALPYEPFSQVEIIEKINFKTEICKNWTIGTCHWGDKCIFAHGYSELRDKKVVKANYKTKRCKQFHETGYCVYGNRCQFKHKELAESPDLSFRKRLPVFIKIEKKGSNLINK
jgi:hypothetical protein